MLDEKRGLEVIPETELLMIATSTWKQQAGGA